MPKKFLLTGSEIRGFRAAKRLHGTLFSLGVTPIGTGTHAKAAFVVSKKVSLKASTRNLVKRRMKAAALSPIRRAPAYALVFTAKKEAAGASFADIRADVAELFDKIASMAKR